MPSFFNLASREAGDRTSPMTVFEGFLAKFWRKAYFLKVNIYVLKEMSESQLGWDTYA
jgi:hypothetical protein